MGNNERYLPYVTVLQSNIPYSFHGLLWDPFGECGLRIALDGSVPNCRLRQTAYLHQNECLRPEAVTG